MQVVQGSISFLPASNTVGPAATTAIVNGRYEFTSENGPYSGNYRVIVGMDLGRQSDSNVDRDPADSLTEETAKRGLARSRRSNPTDSTETPQNRWVTQYTITDQGDDRKDFDFVFDPP